VSVSDSNVDVIYVSPVSVSDELMQYYSRLIGLHPAIQSGDVNDQFDLSTRFRIITPEAVKPFHVSVRSGIDVIVFLTFVFLMFFITLSANLHNISIFSFDLLPVLSFLYYYIS